MSGCHEPPSSFALFAQSRSELLFTNRCSSQDLHAVSVRGNSSKRGSLRGAKNHSRSGGDEEVLVGLASTSRLLKRAFRRRYWTRVARVRVRKCLSTSEHHSDAKTPL